MYALKQLAIKYNLYPKKYPNEITAPILAKDFVDIINRWGRNHEPELLRRFFFQTGILKSIGYLPLAVKLISHHRFPIIPDKIKGINELQTIIKKAEEIGGVL